MQKENSVLRSEARMALSDQWMMAALVTFVYVAVIGMPSIIPIVGGIATLLLLPMAYGLEVMFLKKNRGEELNIGALFDGFSDYGRILGTLLLRGVYVFLWTLLLFVPGVIKTYSYALTSYILLDEPELKNNAAIEKSMQMMEGYKMKLFLLDLSFIGWWLLGMLTFGIGLFWLIPYVSTSRAAFYEELKASL